MEIKKVILILKNEEDEKIYSFLEKLKNKKNIQLKIYTLKKDLKFDSATFVSEDLFETINNILEKENPDIIVFHKERLDPFKMIFTKPEYIKLSQTYKDQKFLFLDPSIENITKIGVVIDFPDDFDFTNFIKDSYKISKFFDSEIEYIFSFHEEYYEYALKKTHTEKEAKEIIKSMKEEKIEKIKETLAKALEGKNAKLKILEGEPKRVIPYYMIENKFDLAIISQSLKDVSHYIENIEISIGII